MELLSQETVTKILEGAKSAGAVAVGAANELTTEAILSLPVASILLLWLV